MGAIKIEKQEGKYKFIITMQSYDTIAKEILKNWQYKFYLIKVRSFMSIIAKKLSKYKLIEDKDKKVFVEYDDKKYCENRKKEIDNFLNSDYKSFKKENNNEMGQYINNRLIQKINHAAHKFTSLMKNKALKISLGGTSTLGFFNRIGITIKTEVLPNSQTET